jgi:sugar-specific transcriptional regulator TrmB
LESEDEDIETLNDLGLTTTEARVYLSLLKTGPEKVQNIARLSKVARPDVYRTISRLRQLGLVETLLTIPGKFHALPMADALYILFTRRDKENAGLHAKAGRMFKKYKKEIVAPHEVSQFILIPERETVVLEREKLMDRAKECVDLIIPLKKLPFIVAKSLDTLKKAVDRGVVIRLVTEQAENEETLLKMMEALTKSSCFELRVTSTQLTVSFGIYDGKEIALNTSAKSAYAEAPDLWSNNTDVIELARNYFANVWITAIVAKPRKQLRT